MYDRAGLLNARGVFAHGIWLDDTDRRALRDACAQIAHSPSSNLFLGSGLFDWRATEDAGVRVSVANYENMLSNALRRAIRLHEKQVAPRISDLIALTQSTGGKIELETVGDRDEEKVIDKLLQKAVLNVFNRHFALHEFDELLTAFDNGLKIDVGDALPSLEYVRQAAEVAGFTPAIKKLGGQGNPAQIASAIELVLEGLHLNRKLNKDRSATRMRYRS